MLTGSPGDRAAAADVVADIRVARETTWDLDRAAVADRVDELIAHPRRLRQGRLNLCGPAALVSLWLARDPVGVARYALDLYRYGWARLGELTVVASRGLRETPYGRFEAATGSPQADWMLLASLRDSANRLLCYDRLDGLYEKTAAITTAATMRRWFMAFPAVVDLSDTTRRVRLPGTSGPRAALVPTPAADRAVLLLVRQALFSSAPASTPASGWRRMRDAVARHLPDHWVVLVDPLQDDGDTVRLRCWTWGSLREVRVPRAVFDVCYFGSLAVSLSPREA